MIKVDKGRITLKGDPLIIISEAAAIYAHIVEMVCKEHPEVDPDKARDILRKTVYLHTSIIDNPELNVFDVAESIGMDPSKIKVISEEECRNDQSE
jgi:hypothetical protein